MREVNRYGWYASVLAVARMWKELEPFRIFVEFRKFKQPPTYYLTLCFGCNCRTGISSVHTAGHKVVSKLRSFHW